MLTPILPSMNMYPIAELRLWKSVSIPVPERYLMSEQEYFVSQNASFKNLTSEEAPIFPITASARIVPELFFSFKYEIREESESLRTFAAGTVLSEREN